MSASFTSDGGEGIQEHNCHLKSLPYSLIVRLETEANLPIYNEIEAAVQLIEAGIDIPSYVQPIKP